jgi:phosphoglucosamine mutase
MSFDSWGHFPRITACKYAYHNSGGCIMTRKLFGTDGIRGTANSEPMTPETALKVAMAVGECFHEGAHKHLVVIGKDTRLSGYMLEPALTAGFVTMGMDVVLVGPLPTPAIAMLTRSLRADLGVILSASHNPYGDNGIKLFGRDGYKLSDEFEQKIEACLDEGPSRRATPAELGRVKRLDDAGGRYIEFVKQSFPRGLRLDGLRIVVDCAHGAAYKVAPTVFWELGAEVFSLGVSPDGLNINRECGALSPEQMRREVLARRADIGIALDGDADRLIIADERGVILDGDQLMALIATGLARGGRLAGGALVATIMSNLGGEQSGHIILSDYATTGDGLIAALQVLASIVETGRRASEVCRLFTPVPQRLRSVRFAEGDPLVSIPVKRAIDDGKDRLGVTGRLVIRKSGTEPVIRVMAEGEDEELVAAVVDEICEAILRAAAGTEDSSPRIARLGSAQAAE